MFRSFFIFELRFWLKGYMVWIFLTVLTGLLFTVLTADEAVLDDVFFGNALRNAPLVINRVYSTAAVFGCLMVAAFVNSAASRDFSCGTDGLIFCKPITRRGFLLGRFLAAMLVSLVPMLGASLAVFLAQSATPGSWWGPTFPVAHVTGLLFFAVPNTFFIAAFVFAVAIWTRSALAAFLSILGLMVALSVSNALVGSLASETIAALADPFGDLALATQTKYWTAADRNSLVPGLSGVLLWNRLLWTLCGGAVLAVGYYSFSFAPVAGRVSRAVAQLRGAFRSVFSGPFHTSELPSVSRDFTRRLQFRQLLRTTRAEIVDTFRSPVFICLIPGVILSVVASLSVRASEGFGLSSLPVSFSVVETIRLSLAEIQIVLITFFAGVLVWKERDANIDEVFDSMPVPSWLSATSKALALLAAVVCVYVVGAGCGFLYQAASGYFDFEPGVYGQQIFLISLTEMFCLIALALVCHVVSPGKYVGYFLFVGLLAANAVVWPLLEVESRLVRFGQLPEHTYSDLFGLQPYRSALVWFGVYWIGVGLLLLLGGVLLWQRGRDTGWRQRLRVAGQRWTGTLRWASGVLLLLCCSSAGWVFWNTRVLNASVTKAGQHRYQADYEKAYKSVEAEELPRVTDVRLEIDLFPEGRRLEVRGTHVLVNQNNVAIDTMLVSLMDPFEYEVHVEGARVTETDERLKTLRFRFDPPLAPGQTRELTFVVRYAAKGFENSVRVPQLVQNGTFINSAILPQIGYFAAMELKDANTREKYGLSDSAIPPLEPQNLSARRNHYINHSSDWVNLETVISTAEDQVAVAPGSLVEEWTQGGRNYFRYRLDHPSVNFFAFVSARYKIARHRWNDVDIEVFYHPAHEWNVDLMLKSVERSLQYCTRAFGPYRHRQARIIEYPRVSHFAQAFAGTMPYSEGVGFIADLKSSDDIDMVFYVVAHEMAHQWWAHQVVGADMRGATVLSETLAQYSALMVMEAEYGRDMMRKFLRYEMDNYLRGRSRENGEERPLSEVESHQGYIHYNKGSVAMYHLKETIGEARVNAALRELVETFAYQPGSYPTSQDLVSALRRHAGPEHDGLITDLFDRITLFENKTLRAECRELEDGRFEVTIEGELAKFHADGLGKLSPSAIDDWIEVGAFTRPRPGRKYGRTLHRERLQVKDSSLRTTFIVSERPHQVGIDPFSLLVDRNAADNMREPTLQTP